MSSPWAGRSSSRMISGRSRLTTYDATEKRKPGEDLLGHRRPAEQLALLEDDGAQAGPGQVGRADQAVVAAADDQRVVRSGHGSSAGVGNEGPQPGMQAA